MSAESLPLELEATRVTAERVTRITAAIKLATSAGVSFNLFANNRWNFCFVNAAKACKTCWSLARRYQLLMSIYRTIFRKPFKRLLRYHPLVSSQHLRSLSTVDNLRRAP